MRGIALAILYVGIVYAFHRNKNVLDAILGIALFIATIICIIIGV